MRPDLKPCPFCGSHLMLLGPSRAQHPVAGCILSGREIAAREFREWNKRARAPGGGQLCSCTAVSALRQIEAGLAFIAPDQHALRAAVKAVLYSASRPGSRALLNGGKNGEDVWIDYKEVDQSLLDDLATALAKGGA
ncbi:hypothetical protein [Paracoccus siganidrum]|uniref:hypothetical protein n=1 Tax=Paracoccus siganidrum TaxID=1276757 RepID=UPI001474C66E|nr:hypothetical protein [Paracoccus siganidrum]